MVIDVDNGRVVLVDLDGILVENILRGKKLMTLSVFSKLSEANEILQSSPSNCAPEVWTSQNNKGKYDLEKVFLKT